MLGLVFAIYESGIYATTNVGIMAALKKLLEFEHVCLNYSELFGIFNAMGPWLSKEHLFA